GGWTADGVAWPALAVSTGSIRALAVLPDAAGRDAERRKDESCCSSAMTGPRATMTWSRRMMRGRPWPGGGCRRARTGWPGSTSWSPRAGARTAGRTRRGSWWGSRLAGGRGGRGWPRAGDGLAGATGRGGAGKRERTGTGGKKDVFCAAGCVGDMGGTRRHQMRELAAGSDVAGAVKIAARAHQKLVWERARHQLRMRSALREYFPAALEACADLTLAGKDALELLAKAPDPESAARVTVTQITAALKRAGRRGDLAQRARDIQAALRTEHLAQPDVITEACAAAVRAGAAVIAALNGQVKVMETKVSELFRRHPD